MQSAPATRTLPNPAFSSALLHWYDTGDVRMPWRGSREPYRIWLSEVMLQQTRVATVEGYYTRFLERFSTVEALAAAPLDDVLKCWEGLGYYARARNLHRLAQQIVQEHAGEFPSSAEALQQLPGIGRYTAGAIASIAFEYNSSIRLPEAICSDLAMRSWFSCSNLVCSSFSLEEPSLRKCVMT